VNITIRADASLAIGSGHVMRCLTLADALQNRGAVVRFLCRAHEGNLVSLVSKRGYACVVLDSTDDGGSAMVEDEESRIPYSAWLGVHWRRDAEQTLDAIKNTQQDWLVVDHYALDWRWQQLMRPMVKKIMVIDGQAQIRQDCDVLLSQSPMQTERDYRGMLPVHCRFLPGADFILLRPEFAIARATALSRRKNTTEVRRFLVNFGGVDMNNLTETALRQLADVGLPDGITVDVILGPACPHTADVKAAAKNLPTSASVFTATDNMAEHMSRADIAIGAGGMTTWERCCLGLPSIVVIAAENQRANAAFLEREGAGISVHAERMVEDMPRALRRGLYDRKWYNEAVSCGSRLIDGKGAGRVAETLKKLQ